jgi:hypothetical protein
MLQIRHILRSFVVGFSWISLVQQAPDDQRADNQRLSHPTAPSPHSAECRRAQEAAAHERAAAGRHRSTINLITKLSTEPGVFVVVGERD